MSNLSDRLAVPSSSLVEGLLSSLYPASPATSLLNARISGKKIRIGLSHPTTFKTIGTPSDGGLAFVYVDANGGEVGEPLHAGRIVRSEDGTMGYWKTSARGDQFFGGFVSCLDLAEKMLSSALGLEVRLD